MIKTESLQQTVLRKVLRLRLEQFLINDSYKNGAFKVPIHLAMGHEAIAIAVDMAMDAEDQLILTHRNIHYNLARLENLKLEIDEYLLKPEGLAGGQLGSMNLTNESRGIMYSSSILGNNLPVAAGFAMAKSVKGEGGVVFVVTGDGAIEEGTFYESLLFEKSNDLPVIVIVENNQWSLGTRIEERRCPIDLAKFAGSLGVHYEHFSSNDPCEYIERLKALKSLALTQRKPVCLEVSLTTLGWWKQKTPDYPDGKFINYHAGPSPSVQAHSDPYLARGAEDPVHVMEKYFSEAVIREAAQNILDELKKEIA